MQYPATIVMHRHPINLILVFLCGCVLSSFAQETGDKKAVADRLIRRADSLLARRQIGDAQNGYEAALEKDPRNIAAAMGLGHAAMALRKWGAAIDRFKEAAEIDTGSLASRYFLGMAYGLRGKSRYVLEKILHLVTENSFEKGRDALAWVLSRDSSYKDALLQTALCYAYEQDYGSAIPIALKQIMAAPGLRGAHVGLYKIAREAIGTHEAATAPDWIAPSLQSYARFFDAEWERTKGRVNEAERILNELLPNPGLVRRPLVLLSMAKIKARLGQFDETERLAMDAIDNIRTLGDADLIFEDIKYIISDDELQEYRALRTGTDAKRFFTTFWSKRNPYPAERSNERIAEHYKRLVYAEQWFEQFSPKTFAPETMPLDFPESYYFNEEFNDKGIIYLRHGEPHEKVVTTRSAGEPAESNESWIYHANDEYPQMMFDFYVPKGAHITEWRLVPVLSDPDMWEDRADYSRTYLRLAQSRSDASVSESLVRATDDGREMVNKGVSSDRFAYTKELQYFDSPVSFTCFRGAHGQTLVSLGYLIAPGEIGKAFPDSVKEFEVLAEYAIYDSAWRKVATAQKEQTYKRVRMDGDVMIDRFQAGVVPDSYTVAWQARPVEGRQVFSRKMRARVPDFSGSSLMMSDLELAYSIEPAKNSTGFGRGSLSVVPNPAMRCPLNRPLYLYFEGYNLTKDAKGKTSYTIEYQLKSIELEKSFLTRLLSAEKKTSVTVPSERSGTTDWSPEYVAIDVSDLEPGRYQLQVTLTDNVARKSVLRSITADIYQRR